ncbi:MAG: Arginine-binding extracellular protein ArtP precursor [Alphaproteobacteria bacterium ADurb.Bin438]|nr:MAG: Arginine-binding extracellular protein ArtP precursor [Alphaproteobacteria bacterium ADurb.Bin438]
MKKLFKTIIASLMFISFGMISNIKASEIDNLKLLTEDYPPFNYKEGSDMRGISVDILSEILKKAGSKLTVKDINLLPWANSYKKVQEEKDTMLFVMTRSEARENLFKWVGPVSPSRVVLFAKKGSGITINSYEDVKAHSVGAIRDDITEQLLVENGIDRTTLDLSSTTEAHIKKFNAGRFELLADAEIVGKWRYKSAGLSPDDLEVVFVMSVSQLYYALNKQTSDEVVGTLQKALDELKASGVVETINNKYLK